MEYSSWLIPLSLFYEVERKEVEGIRWEKRKHGASWIRCSVLRHEDPSPSPPPKKKWREKKEQVYSSLFIWCCVPVTVCGLIAFLPKKNEGPSNKEPRSIHASCPNPPNVAVTVSVTSGESGIPTRERDKLSAITTLLELLPEPSQGRSPTLQLKDLFIRLIFTLILSLNSGFYSDSLRPWA